MQLMLSLYTSDLLLGCAHKRVCRLRLRLSCRCASAVCCLALPRPVLPLRFELKALVIVERCIHTERPASQQRRQTSICTQTGCSSP